MELVAKTSPAVVADWGGRGVFEGVERPCHCFVEVEKLTKQSHGVAMRTSFLEADFKSNTADNFASKLSGSSIVEVAKDGKDSEGGVDDSERCRESTSLGGGPKMVPH
jgi:hypothetical protein